MLRRYYPDSLKMCRVARQSGFAANVRNLQSSEALEAANTSRSRDVGTVQSWAALWVDDEMTGMVITSVTSHHDPGFLRMPVGLRGCR